MRACVRADLPSGGGERAQLLPGEPGELARVRAGGPVVDACPEQRPATGGEGGRDEDGRRDVGALEDRKGELEHRPERVVERDGERARLRRREDGVVEGCAAVAPAQQ